MAEVELKVDGELVDLVDTIRLRQRDPWPGGHEYRLTLRGGALTEFDRLGGSASSGRDGDAVFFAVEGLAAGLPGEGRIPARFILNTVDQVIRKAEQVTIAGRCSVPMQ